MIKKAFRLLYNSVRFIGKPCYRNLLAVDASVRIENDPTACMQIGKSFRARKNVELNVRSGRLTIGDNVFFNSGCILTVREAITVGDHTICGPNVVFYDHDHKVENGKILDSQYVCSPITIGKNVWIGAGTIILKGASVGDNCVIAAGSLITGNIPANTTLVQKRDKQIISHK